MYLVYKTLQEDGPPEALLCQVPTALRTTSSENPITDVVPAFDFHAETDRYLIAQIWTRRHRRMHMQAFEEGNSWSVDCSNANYITT